MKRRAARRMPYEYSSMPKQNLYNRRVLLAEPDPDTGLLPTAAQWEYALLTITYAIAKAREELS